MNRAHSMFWTFPPGIGDRDDQSPSCCCLSGCVSAQKKTNPTHFRLRFSHVGPAPAATLLRTCDTRDEMRAHRPWFIKPLVILQDMFDSRYIYIYILLATNEFASNLKRLLVQIEARICTTKIPKYDEFSQWTLWSDISALATKRFDKATQHLLYTPSPPLTRSF